jgi:hypothetical protein
VSNDIYTELALEALDDGRRASGLSLRAEFFATAQVYALLAIADAGVTK